MHPFAMPNNRSGGNSGSIYEVNSGDRIYHELSGRKGVLDECLSDGDAFVTWDDGTYETVKWNHLIPERMAPGNSVSIKEILPP
jgi:hypothetical protein